MFAGKDLQDLPFDKVFVDEHGCILSSVFEIPQNGRNCRRLLVQPISDIFLQLSLRPCSIYLSNLARERQEARMLDGEGGKQQNNILCMPRMRS